MPQAASLVPRRSLISALATLSLAACAGQGVTQTGFLGSYDGMLPTKEHADDRIFIDPAYDAKSYHSILIDPVAWSPAPNTPSRAPEAVEQLKADFQACLAEKLSQDFTVLDRAPSQAGPGVIRVRAAITNTRQAHWWINAPVTAAAIGLAVVGLPAGGGVPSPAPGGASEEMEVLDLATGKRLIAIATFNNAMPWNKLGDFEQFGHARRAFRIAADLLQEQLRRKPLGEEATRLALRALR